jgi:acyl-coenzyme A synthetase/AMP-(fatty) acid ligase
MGNEGASGVTTNIQPAAFTSLHRLLAVGRDASAIVCHHENGAVTWRDFAQTVTGVAGFLSTRPEQRWLITAGDAYEFSVWLLALLYAGKQLVIPPNLQAGTLSSLAGAHDAVTPASLPRFAEAPVLAPIDPALAYIDLYTSGSTGLPKQIRKSLLQLETEIAVLESMWGDRLEGAAVVATVPHHHIYGLLFRLLWPLSAGRPFDVEISVHPDTLKRRIETLGKHVLISSPAQLSRLPQLLALDVLQPRSELVFSSGGPLPASAAQAFLKQTGQAPMEIFGSTETGGIAWRQQLSQDWWTPLPGIRIENDGPHPLLHSSFLPDETLWRLDDSVELAADGRFRLKGRLDRIVKIEEKRISLHELEQRLAEHPWVDEAAAIVLKGRRQSIGVALTLTPLGKQAMREGGRVLLRTSLRTSLAEYYEATLLPRYWRYPAQLPFNAQGKLTQQALLKLFAVTDESAAA